MIKLNTNHGAISVELFTDKAPITTDNFVQYAKEGFYNGTIFHRVIDGFMIQGGGMEPGLKEKQTRANIKNEADNGLKNSIGTLAMARTPDPDSASSQFFINIKDNDFLNYRSSTPDGWGYCVFGKVIDGMDVVEAIRGVETGNQGMHQDVPVTDVILESVEITES